MAARLAVNVAVRHPTTGAVETFEAGSTPPKWAREEITNPEAWEGEADAGGAEDAGTADAPAETEDAVVADVAPTQPKGPGGGRQVGGNLRKER